MSETTIAAQSPDGAAELDNSENGVIQLGGSGREREPVEMVPLFAIDGKTYKVPKKIRPNVGLQIISKFEQDGEVVAVMYMLRRLLGQEALDALLGYDDLAAEDMEAVTNKLMEMTYSSLEKPSGN